MTIMLCVHCANHYGDTQPCDEGKPVNSPHRTKGLPLPPVSDRLCDEGVVCAGCGSYPCHPDCSRGVRDYEPWPVERGLTRTDLEERGGR